MPPLIVLSEKDADAYEAFAASAEETWKARVTTGDLVREVLGTVRDFLAANERVVYGGMAIDTAFRAADAPPLYAADVLPDYDAYSPDHANDAYALAEILSRAYPDNVFKVGPALHIQTMRIWTDFHDQPVADLSFIPASVYAKVPTITRDGLKFVHPFWQFIDMHLAFGNPFGRFPLDNVFCRWAKDLPRYAQLRGLYPVVTPAEGAAAPAPAPTVTVVIHSALIAVPWVLGGFGALAALGLIPGGVSAGKEDGLPTLAYAAPAFHTSTTWENAASADVIATTYSAAAAQARVAAAAVSYAQTTDTAWAFTDVSFKSSVMRVESADGCLVPFASVDAGADAGALRVAAPHVLMKQFAFWAVMRADPRYWTYYEMLASRAHNPATDAAAPSSPYWDLAETVSTSRLIGSRPRDGSEEATVMRLAVRRDGAVLPVLDTIPRGYTPGRAAPPPFEPRGRWFEFDGRKLSA